MSLSHAWQAIQEAKIIILLTHYKPDADGISACAALDHVLRRMGKTVQAVYPSKDESALKRQPLDVQIAQHTVTPDLLIACDTANYDRLYFPEEFKTIPLINIDHHISNALQGIVNIVNPDAASTCEELFHLLMGWCPDLVDKYTAECLLFGILYDTQVFHTQSTSARVLKTAAACLEHGVNMFYLSRELLAHKDPRFLPFWGKALQSIKMDTKKQVLWVIVRQADLHASGLEMDALVGLNNFIAESSPLDTTITFYEDEQGRTKVSLRSKTRDVNKIAGLFGGGGHTRASGVLMAMPIDEAVEKLITAID